MRISDAGALQKYALLLCMAAHAAITFSYAVTLHYTFKTSGFDDMCYEQAMRNFIDGKGFTSSINPPFIPQFWLGFHFSPILYLLVPFYYLFPHVEMFLAAGSMAVALAAWPLFLTAKAILQDSFQALLVALLYLLNPFVFNGVLRDFHEVDFAPLCLAWMLWAVVHRKRGLLAGLSIVLMAIKEHYGLSVAGFGLLWAWHWKDKKFGLALAASGLAVVWLLFAVVIPHFNPTGAPTMMNSASLEDRFSWITSMTGIRAHIDAIATDAFWYGLKLLLPLLLLPLLSFAWLLPALADAGVNVLSQETMLRSQFSYHSMALVPVLMVAFCQSVRKYCNGRWRFSADDMMLPVAVAMAAFAYMQVSLPLSQTGNIWELSAPQFGYLPQDGKALDDINQLIPEEAPVAAQVNLLPHLKVRYSMVPYPFSTHADYIVLNLAFPFRHSTSVLGIPYGVTNYYFFTRVESLLHNPDWGIVYYSNRWLVMRKDTSDQQPDLRQEAQDDMGRLRDEYQVIRNQ